VSPGIYSNVDLLWRVRTSCTMVLVGSMKLVFKA